jgi:hypothetical protein
VAAGLLRGVGVVAETCLYACGAYGLVVTVKQVSLLFLVITIGPGAPWVTPPRDQFQSFILALVLMMAAIAAATRLRHVGYGASATLVLQAGMSLFALSASYRFVALLVFVALLGCRVTRPAQPALARGLCATVLVISLMPMDVSLRVVPRSAGVVLAEGCHSRRSVEADNAGEIVCVNAGTWLYSEPRWVWVW